METAPTPRGTQLYWQWEINSPRLTSSWVLLEGDDEYPHPRVPRTYPGIIRPLLCLLMVPHDGYISKYNQCNLFRLIFQNKLHHNPYFMLSNRVLEGQITFIVKINV